MCIVSSYYYVSKVPGSREAVNECGGYTLVRGLPEPDCVTDAFLGCKIFDTWSDVGWIEESIIYVSVLVNVCETELY